MKRLICLFLIMAFGCSLLTACTPTETPATGSTAKTDEAWTVASPDGRLKIEVTRAFDGGMHYSVEKSDVTVVERSELGLTIAEDDLGFTTVSNVTTREVSGSYENISGKTSTVTYDCNELVVTLSAWTFDMDMIFRAYDDGYAYRYEVRARDGSEGVMTVLEEKSQFALPTGATLWAQQYVTNKAGRECFSYETEYYRRALASVKDQYIAMPMLYKVKGANMYSLITESALIGSGYWGSFLHMAGEGNDTTFRTVHTPAGITLDDNQVAYPFSSPWRMGITGDLGECIASELVEKVYDDTAYWRPDNYAELTAEEQKTFDYDWVEAGVSSWNYLTPGATSNQGNMTAQMEYVDLSAEMGWGYIILDAGWQEASDSDLERLVTYAAERDVKVIVWCNALPDFANGNVTLLANKLDAWKAKGIAGIKIDFFDGQSATNAKHQGEDIGTIKWYESIYQETAKREMVVLCHGCNKPTGERRIYPNVLSREAVYGNEFYSVSGNITVMSMFTRAIIGGTDFTPTVKPRSSGMTMAHQMALAILYESGVEIMAGAASDYADETIKAFYESIPARRDETRYIAGNPDDYCVIAVRAGDTWFVAGINALFETSVEVSFDFLGEGTYTAELYLNDTDAYDQIVRTDREVTSASAETVTMIPNGGFVWKLTPKK